MKKISRNQFFKNHESKIVSLIGLLNYSERNLKCILDTLNKPEKYREFIETPKSNKFTGLFHKRSHGFYRECKDGTNSYHDFYTGDYILSDDKISIIVSPKCNRILIYRIDGTWNEDIE